MKVIIAGSRTIHDSKKAFQFIKESGFDITEVVSGTAQGVDMIGEEYAVENNIPVKYFPASWMQYGVAAGLIRNKDMAAYADALIAVWDGESKGTKHMIRQMQNLGKPVKVHMHKAKMGETGC